MFLKKTRPSVKVSLIAGVALLLSSGVSLAVDQLKVSQPDSLGVSNPKSAGVSGQVPLGVSNPDSLKVSEPRSMKAGTFPEGEFTRPERENTAYNRCAKLEGFEAQKKCALEAIGIIVEEEK